MLRESQFASLRCESLVQYSTDIQIDDTVFLLALFSVAFYGKSFEP